MSTRPWGPARGKASDPATRDRRGERVASIDAIRGVAVLLMAMGNLGLGAGWEPSWLKHTPDVGLTIADLVAPLFIVVSGSAVTRGLERRRAREGTPAALGWLARRSLELIAMGAVISAGQAALKPVPGIDMSWGVLQSIGGAGLLLAAVVLLAPWVRVVVAVLLLAAYQWLLAGPWGAAVLHTVQGGLPGTLAWGALMILSSAITQPRRGNPRPLRSSALLVPGAAAVLVGLALATIVPISKNRVSPSYVAICLGISLLGWGITQLWFGRRPESAGWIRRVGRFPLQMYFAQLLLLAPLTLVADPWWYAAAPPWLTVLEALAMALALIALAGVLDRRGPVLRL